MFEPGLYSSLNVHGGVSDKWYQASFTCPLVGMRCYLSQIIRRRWDARVKTQRHTLFRPHSGMHRHRRDTALLNTVIRIRAAAQG